MYPTDLTVSAVIEDNGRYLLVEEYSMGDVLLKNHIRLEPNGVGVALGFEEFINVR